MPLTSFEKGKLKIAAHVREELERAGISFESIRCKSGDVHTRRGAARLTVTVAGNSYHVELSEGEVEGCELIVVGETWHKIAAFLRTLQ